MFSVSRTSIARLLLHRRRACEGGILRPQAFSSPSLLLPGQTAPHASLLYGGCGWVVGVHTLGRGYALSFSTLLISCILLAYASGPRGAQVGSQRPSDGHLILRAHCLTQNNITTPSRARYEPFLTACWFSPTHVQCHLAAGDFVWRKLFRLLDPKRDPSHPPSLILAL